MAEEFGELQCNLGFVHDGVEGGVAFLVVGANRGGVSTKGVGDEEEGLKSGLMS